MIKAERMLKFSMLRPNRWEHGSAFHWLFYSNFVSTPAPWNKNGNFYASGRDAFRALILYGQASRGWKRLWIPSYYCQEVTKSFLSTGIDVAVYIDGPEDNLPDFNQCKFKLGDVILRVNFFGLRVLHPLNKIIKKDIEVVDDHTHDPWSSWAWSSDADWCIASLRKVLPVPDGGVLWSPKNLPLPPAVSVTNVRRVASLENFVAMVLKGLYLANYPLDKDIFRNLSISAEKCFAIKDISGMTEWSKSLLTSFPIDEWRELRRRNYKILSVELANIPWLTVLKPEDDSSACPFSCIIVFDTPERRNYVLQKLIASHVYPAILWPLDVAIIDNIPQKHVSLSLRMLSIHCDMRYNKDDMKYVSSLIYEFGEKYIRKV